MRTIKQKVEIKPGQIWRDNRDHARQIRVTKPVSIIFAITGWAPLFEIEECREAGFDDYFEKPLDMDFMLAVVEDAFKKLERWKRRYNNIQA